MIWRLYRVWLRVIKYLSLQIAVKLIWKILSGMLMMLQSSLPLWKQVTTMPQSGVKEVMES
ncbi:hypothetical protein ABW22_02835 [Thiobacillus denitrificans]|uniref:Uncharacterized protein n=1 Tax=Thiobacillus denitrificans TaxID=36861 RepID=A0A119CXZ7_THIDE|nr:hypothetical protein ABW22_02835 [Thiobacillus denitrificans]